MQLQQSARELESLTANRITQLRHQHGRAKAMASQAKAVGTVATG